MGTKSHQKHPITVDLLRHMRTVLDLSIPTQAALWCLFLVAFFSFLRKSNLTAPSAHAFDPSKHLTGVSRVDLSFSSCCCCCTSRVRNKPSPWLNPNIKQLMFKRDWLKKKATKTGMSEDWTAYGTGVKINKATGIDKISNRILKLADPVNYKSLTDLFNFTYKT